MCWTYRLLRCVPARLSAPSRGRLALTRVGCRGLSLFGVVCLLVSVVSCAKPQGNTIPEQRNAVREMQQATLAEFYASKPDMRTRLRQAAGYGVFSNRGTGILLFSTGNGYGVVTNNATGKETIMRMAQVGVGLGIGIKDYRAVFVFYDPQVLSQFVQQGWDFGGQADAAAKVGEQGGATSGAVSATPGMEIYQFTETGFALRAGLAGTKYWKDTDLN